MIRKACLATAFAVALVSTASAATISYTARLAGTREVPKTESKGTGKLEATYDTATKALNYTLTFDGLSGPETAAHLHGPAARGANAGVIVPLGDKGATSPITGTATLTDEQAKELQTGKVYVNVHTAANPGGEIRGQVMHAGGKKKPASTAATAAPAAKTP
jgi:CHRD domain